MTDILLTVDTELSWRQHRVGHDLPMIVQRSLEPAGVGITHQLKRLAACGLKATFFVDPMPATVFGIDPIARVVDAVLGAGQEVQLHLHPGWTHAVPGDRGIAHAPFNLVDYAEDQQAELIGRAIDLLMAAGAPRPVAFRAGSYAANDATLRALAAHGIRYDSSHNGSAAPFPSGISLPPSRIAPIAHQGVVEVPVTVIHDAPDRLRHFQICALSSDEMRGALDHAAAAGHPVVTIVSHSFELANRTGTRANGVHVGRFEALIRLLADRADRLPTRHFAELPEWPLDRADTPLPPDAWRTARRRIAQLWSNWVEERAA